ncbi:metal ABC transporter solute-binding protein, Zn/Mn family [Gemelliphila palaticanis]|uniref:Zinc ABC transporter substrate-binding protein n=1 Tax=Gemelliphila palaticanis TaxID=81950 RepID=A0ABX2T214_9BACL|nr:zinc ABC transporter substrate-binding protein [Gemella palaticanis]MBF0715753.1 zinc ABC transporter substrate-binding protein [Gemella palaticanis]NYS47683.1 zinc ABC transporter substrate-binding protein [Gemella palaticanis]
MIKTKSYKTIKKLIYLLVMTLIISACSKDENNNEKLKIATSINFYSEVAQNIAKDKAEVISIISNSSVDPHDFEPSADDAKNIADSNIAIFNGGGYDSWFEKLTNNNKDIVKINAAELINLKDGENEHIWYNPQVLKNVAENLTEELIKKDPQNKEFYITNKNSYLDELEKINDKVKELKNKSKGKVVLTTEPIFDYSIEVLELKTTEDIKKLAKATSEGNDPSPQTLKNIQEDIKNKKIDFVVNNIQTTNKAIEGIINLSEENGIPILNVSETQPNDKTYVEWMIDQYDKLLNILNGNIGEKAYHTKDAKEGHNHNHDHEHGHDHNH